MRASCSNQVQDKEKVESIQNEDAHVQPKQQEKESIEEHTMKESIVHKVEPESLQRQEKMFIDGLAGIKSHQEEINKIAEKFGEFKFGPQEEDGVDRELREATKLKNGDWYYGYWNTATKERDGRGVLIWVDGSRFDGYWKNDKPNGLGRLIYYKGDVYEGNWVEGTACGHGKYFYSDGAIYEGEWLNDMQHGKGTETWTEGSSYDGEYNAGNKHGNGYFSWADGSFYQGEFAKYKLDGKGYYKWSDGKKYDGEWKNNQMHGRGTFSYSDGKIYIGEFFKDQREGYGTMIWPYGHKYEGEWLNGKQHGRGSLFNSKGEHREFMWDKGKKVSVFSFKQDPIQPQRSGRKEKKKPRKSSPEKAAFQKK